ncbi:MAG: type-F conjugative transfer system secretin TraK [Rhodobacteraceae bacterium]|nr:type-F conjugative transfer system secretin TraK [Paracoccaceae bacterium]
MNFYKTLKALIAIVAILSSSIAHAGQTYAVMPDGEITFDVSTTGITRVSFTNDRIRRVVHGETDFEMTNDEATGDVFMRFVGIDPRNETGYFVTERGITIGYTLLPKDEPVSPVLITINGVDEEPDPQDNEGNFGASVGFSDNVAASMADIVRVVAAEHVLGRAVPSGRDGRRIHNKKGEGWIAEVRIAVAGPDGRLVREQEFYKPGVLAIWIAQSQLGPNERTWLIVVKGN